MPLTRFLNTLDRVHEIQRDNQHLLSNLLKIAKGQQCATAQKLQRPQRAIARSLNYVSKKREAERIDRENQRIMKRIINIKPQLVKARALDRSYGNGQGGKRRLYRNKAGQHNLNSDGPGIQFYHQPGSLDAEYGRLLGQNQRFKDDFILHNQTPFLQRVPMMLDGYGQPVHFGHLDMVHLADHYYNNSGTLSLDPLVAQQLRE